jgi:hypothetical protein
VPGGADAALEGRGVVMTGQDRRDVVGEFDPTVCGVEDLGGDLEAAPEFRPEPFGGVGVAAFGQVLGAMLFGLLRAGGNKMQLLAKVPVSVIYILQGLVIVSVIIGMNLKNVREKNKMKKVKAGASS